MCPRGEEAAESICDENLGFSKRGCPASEFSKSKMDFEPYQVKLEKGKVAKKPHPNLKVVEIVGYRARPFVVEHVIYLIDNAVALEKIVVDPVRRWLYPSTTYASARDRGVAQVKEEEIARDHAMQHLKEQMPSTIGFECL